MKRYLALAMFLVLAVALVSPFSVSAKTKAGVKSGSFFYFFDKTFEKANLFFTFNPEKKAKKALENAEERLAEAEESASENKPEAVMEAMENYHKNIEVLEKVLAKVPEEAKEAITKAIEADKERQEEMTKKIEEINNEIKKEDDDLKKDEEEKLNDDVGDDESDKEEVENENKDENKKDEQKKEIEKLKKEVEGLKQKQPQVKIIEKPIIIEKKESSSSQINSQTKQNENIVTLPNGAVVEMDANGNVVRTIKEVENTPQVSTFKHVIVNAPQYVSREIKKGQTNAPLISLRLQSVGDTPVRVEEVNIRIVGPVVVIKTVKIENCGIAQSLSDKGEATLVCPISIKNGLSNNYNIVADISDNISSENGKTIQVSVESIKAEDAVISGEFPIVSAPHKIIAPPPLPKVTASSGRGNDQPKKIGTKDYIFSGIKISTDKKVFIQSIRWNNPESGSLSQLENLKIYIDDIPYGGHASDGKYFTSDFGGIVINPNETREIYIKGDIVGDVGKWLSFDIHKASDVNITDESGNVVIPQAEQLWDYENSGGFRRGNPWYDGYKVEIKN